MRKFVRRHKAPVTGLVATMLALVVFSVLSGAAQAAPNILLIFGDDMGVETLASYGVGENPPTTTTLAATGGKKAGQELTLKAAVAPADAAGDARTGTL